MKQVDLVEILRSRETYDKDHPTISIYDALEAMKEACNQTVDLCAENAEVTINSIEDLKLIVDKKSILDTKKQIV